MMYKLKKNGQYNLKIIIHENGLYLIDVISKIKLNIKLYENWILIIMKNFDNNALEIINFLSSKSKRLEEDYNLYLKMIDEI